VNRCQVRTLGHRVARLALVGAAAACAASVVSCEREDRKFRVEAPAASTTFPSTRPASRSAPPPARFPRKNPYERSAYAVAQGGKLYEQFNCVGCHSHGGGGIGPALMDNAWIHGSDPEEVFDTIVEGRPNGMPSFRARIPDYQVWQIVAYVRSMSGLIPRGAAPGRDDHMAAAPPPNSVPARRPEITPRPLEETRHLEVAELQRLGWIEPASGRERVPEAVVRRVSRSSATRPTTRAAR